MRLHLSNREITMIRRLLLVCALLAYVAPRRAVAQYITITGTTSITGADQVNNAVSVRAPQSAEVYYRGVIVVVNVTTLTGTTPTITPVIQGKDAASGLYAQLHTAFTAI